MPLFFLISVNFFSANSLRAEANPKYVEAAAKAFESARVNYLAHATNSEAAWQFARVAFDHAEFAKTGKEREEIAIQAIAAARKSVEIEPNNPATHYYLAMNLGELARTKSLGALKLVKEMEREFRKSAEIDNKLDFAGAERSLGVLYLEAPGWPTSIGNKTKAREHLQTALRLSPEYPENHVALMEAFEKWGEKQSLKEALSNYKNFLRVAREQFKGEQWESFWADWNERYRKLLRKLNEGEAEE